MTDWTAFSARGPRFAKLGLGRLCACRAPPPPSPFPSVRPVSSPSSRFPAGGGTTLHLARLGHRLPRRGPPTRLGVTQEPLRQRRPGDSVSAWSPHRPSGRMPGAGGKARLTPSTLCRQRRRQPEGERVWPPIGGAGGAGPRGGREVSEVSPCHRVLGCHAPDNTRIRRRCVRVCACTHVCACVGVHLCMRVCTCVSTCPSSLLFFSQGQTSQSSQQPRRKRRGPEEPPRGGELSAASRRPRGRSPAVPGAEQRGAAVALGATCPGGIRRAAGAVTSRQWSRREAPGASTGANAATTDRWRFSLAGGRASSLRAEA